MLDRTQAPATAKLNEDFDLQPAQVYHLSNGIKLHALLSGKQKALRLEFIFDGGNWNQQTLGASFFTTKLLSAGTKDYSAKQIEQIIASAGAFLELESNSEKNTLTLYLLEKHLKSILPVIFQMLTVPLFPTEELANLKKITQQNLSVSLQKTSFVASSNFKEIIFGSNHPYGRQFTHEIIEQVTDVSLHQFFEQTFQSQNCDIVISGNSDLDLHALMNEYFGQASWGGNAASEGIAYNLAYKPSSINIDNPEAVQSSIRMGMPMFNLKHPDYFKSSILVEIFGGYFGSRLMKNIREEKGYTYGISASLVSMKHAGYLVIGTDVNAENTQNTITEIKNEITLLKNEAVGEEELNLVKNYLIGTFLNSLNSPFAIADKYKNIYFNKLDLDFYQKYIKTIDNITAEDIKLLAQKYFTIENMSTVIVGKQK